MKALPELRRLQRWFALVVEHPSTADVAIGSRSAAALVPARAVASLEILRGNPRMTPAQQLQVYNGGYVARLVEVLQGDFGAVQHVVGEEHFRALVARYVALHPSRHPNLNQLGRHFPAFLARQRRLEHRAFLVELARLELAMSRAFDAPEFTPLGQADIAAVPPDNWDVARLVLNPSVQLLSFAHPVDVFFQAWKEEKPAAVPERTASWLCVYRRDDRVWRQRLARPAHAVLSALAAGQPLANALQRAGDQASVGEWFRGFASVGLFTAIEHPRKKPRSKRR